MVGWDNDSQNKEWGIFTSRKEMEAIAGGTENGNILLQELLVLFASSWAETCTNTIALPKRTAPVHREELRALVDAVSSISVPSLVNLPITANPYQ